MRKKNIHLMYVMYVILGTPYAFDARHNDILKPFAPFFHFPYSIPNRSLSFSLFSIYIYLSLFFSKANKIVETEKMRVHKERTGFLLSVQIRHYTYILWIGMKWNHIDFYFLSKAASLPVGSTACHRMCVSFELD